MKTLKEIRAQFVKLSGREDLIDVSGNFFIQGAVTDLDLEQETGEDFNWYQESFSIGDYKTKMKHCRSIQAVWFVDSDDETVPLDKLLYDELITKYSALGETDDGTPAHWSKNPLQRDPNTHLAGESIEYTGAIIMPPTDEAITIKIYGIFHSVPLEEDDDENGKKRNIRSQVLHPVRIFGPHGPCDTFFLMFERLGRFR